MAKQIKVSEKKKVSKKASVSKRSSGPVQKVKMSGGDSTAVTPDEIDEYREDEIKEMARDIPEVRFRHSSKFTDDEDKIIAAGLMDHRPVYKIAMALRCSRQLLKKHIDESPELAQVALDAYGREQDEVEEGIQRLKAMTHPQALLWLAERLLPEKYGKDRSVGEEDDTRIIIGAIPEEDLVKGDEILAEAASKPPEAGLAAMLDQRAMAEIDDKIRKKKGQDEGPSLDAVILDILGKSGTVDSSEKEMAKSVPKEAGGGGKANGSHASQGAPSQNGQSKRIDSQQQVQQQLPQAPAPELGSFLNDGLYGGPGRGGDYDGFDGDGDGGSAGMDFI